MLWFTDDMKTDSQMYVPMPVLFSLLDLYIQQLAWHFIWILEKYLKLLPQTHLALKLRHLSKYSSSFQVENVKHPLEVSLFSHSNSSSSWFLSG